MLIDKVHPAQDWKRDEADGRSGKKRKKRRMKWVPPGNEVRTLDDLRAALERAYLGKQMAVTFILDMGRPVGVTVALNEECPVVF